MTLHVCPRLISGLLLFAAVLLRSPTPAAAQSVAPQETAPTLAERLDRLAAEIDRNRRRVASQAPLNAMSGARSVHVETI